MSRLDATSNYMTMTNRDSGPPRPALLRFGDGASLVSASLRLAAGAARTHDCARPPNFDFRVRVCLAGDYPSLRAVRHFWARFLVIHGIPGRGFSCVEVTPDFPQTLQPLF